MLGRLDDDTRRNLSLLLLAIAQNRADDVADLIIGLSRTSLDSDEPGFLQDIRRKLPRYHGRPLAKIRAGEALADLLVNRLETGTFKVGVVPTDLEGLETVMRSVANRIGGAVIVAALLVSSALLARVHDLRWMAFGGFCCAFVLGLYLLWKIMRTPGEL